MKKLIEINEKAKPYNPAEEVLGTELFWMMDICQLVGWHYYCDNPPPNKGKHVIALTKPGQYGNTIRAIEKRGWRPVKITNNAFLVYDKAVMNGEDKIRDDSLIVITNFNYYDSWVDAAEVCKLLGPKYPEDKKMVEYIHSIVIEGYKVKLDKEGKIEDVVPPKKPAVVPDMGGFAQEPAALPGVAAGHAQGAWHPQPHGGGVLHGFAAPQFGQGLAAEAMAQQQMAAQVAGVPPLAEVQWHPAPEEQLGLDQEPDNGF